MISVHYVKRRIIELLRARSHFEGVAINYGPPETQADVAGDNPLFAQHIEFGDPAGVLDVDEMCGASVSEFFERYELPLVVETIARTRDATPDLVEDNRAWLQWEITQALQDPTLGFTAAKDTRISKVYVYDPWSIETASGWLTRGGTNLAAARTEITLTVEAKVLNE